MKIKHVLLQARKITHIDLAVSYRYLPVLAAMLSACGGGGSPDPQPLSPGENPVSLNVDIIDTSVVPISSDISQVSFTLASSTLAANEMLNCHWQADLEDSVSAPLDFACTVGVDNDIQFNTKNDGDIEGKLSVSLPDNRVVSSVVAYTVNNDSDNQLVDISSEIGTPLSEQFYLFRQGESSQTLFYFPKKMSITSFPGVGSLQLRDTVDDLLAIFLMNSATDWLSQDQLLFTTRYSLAADTQELQSIATANGYANIKELGVSPPIMQFVRRYTTDIQQANIDVSCDNLSQMIDDRTVILLDCAIVDRSVPEERTSINTTSDVFFEKVGFDPNEISSHSAIRGNISVTYTLPGTHLVTRLFDEGEADLATTFQLIAQWPLSTTTIETVPVVFHWQDIFQTLVDAVSLEQYRWSNAAIERFAEGLLLSGHVDPGGDAATATLLSSIVPYIKQQLFVSIATKENPKQTLFWVPRLRFEDVNNLASEELDIVLASSDSWLTTELDLACLSWDRVQSNLFRSSSCGQ